MLTVQAACALEAGASQGACGLSCWQCNGTVLIIILFASCIGPTGIFNIWDQVLLFFMKNVLLVQLQYSAAGARPDQAEVECSASIHDPSG